MTYRHPGLGFALDPGSPWGLLEERDDGVRLAVDRPDPVVVTLRVAPVAPGWEAERLALAAVAAEAQALGDRRVIERGEARLGGLPAVRVVYTGDAADGAITIEQWHAVQGARGWILAVRGPVSAAAGLAETSRRAAAGLVLPPPGAAPAPPPRFDAAAGVLDLSDEELEAMGALFAGEPADPAAVAALEAAGVVAGGTLAAAAAEMVRTMRGAEVSIGARREGAAPAAAWRCEGRAAVLLPAGAARRQLRLVPGDRLPRILGDFLDLGPRPTDSGRTAIETAPGALAEAFAGRPGALAELVARRRDHWRVDAGRSVLEAIDAPGGWWLVRPGRGTVVLEPTDAATLWAHLAELA